MPPARGPRPSAGLPLKSSRSRWLTWDTRRPLGGARPHLARGGNWTLCSCFGPRRAQSWHSRPGARMRAGRRIRRVRTTSRRVAGSNASGGRALHREACALGACVTVRGDRQRPRAARLRLARHSLRTSRGAHHPRGASASPPTPYRRMAGLERQCAGVNARQRCSRPAGSGQARRAPVWRRGKARPPPCQAASASGAHGHRRAACTGSRWVRVVITQRPQTREARRRARRWRRRCH